MIYANDSNLKNKLQWSFSGVSKKYEVSHAEKIFVQFFSNIRLLF